MTHIPCAIAFGAAGGFPRLQQAARVAGAIEAVRGPPAEGKKGHQQASGGEKKGRAASSVAEVLRPLGIIGCSLPKPLGPLRLRVLAVTGGWAPTRPLASVSSLASSPSSTVDALAA